MRFAIYLSILCALVPLVFTRPFFGLCLYYVVSLLQPKLLCWRGDFQDAMIVGVPLVLGAVTVGVRRRVLEPRIDPRTGTVIGADQHLTRSRLFEFAWPLGALALLMIYLTFNRVISRFPLESTSESFRALWKVVLVTALLTGMATDFRRFRILYVVVALSVAFWAVKGGIKVLLIGPHQVYGKTYDNNLFALTSVMVLPMVFYHAMTVRHARWRFALFAASALISLAIICSQSRAGFVALAVVTVCMAWSSRYRFRVVGAVAMLGICILFVSRNEIEQRVQSIISYQSDQSARSRLGSWNTAIAVWAANPVFGVGFNQYQPAARAMFGGKREAHNIFLQNLAELGVVGHPIWLACVLGVPLSMYRFMRQTRLLPVQYRWAYYWARGLLLGLLGFAIHGFFHNEEYLELMVTMVGLTVALRIMTRRVLMQDGLVRIESARLEAAHIKPTTATPGSTSPGSSAHPAAPFAPRPLAWGR